MSVQFWKCKNVEDEVCCSLSSLGKTQAADNLYTVRDDSNKIVRNILDNCILWNLDES